jgi:hypothetical protein
LQLSLDKERPTEDITTGKDGGADMTAYIEVQTKGIRRAAEAVRREFKQVESRREIEVLGTPAVHVVNERTLAVCTLAWCGAIPR